MSEQLTRPGMNPPEGLKVGMLGEQGFYIPDTEAEREVVLEEVQKVRKSVTEFSEAVIAGHNGDIDHLTSAENEVWDEIAEIGDTLAESPGTEVNESQKDLLASTEAYTAAIKTAKNLSEAQSRVLFVQDAESVAPILNQMAKERRLSIEASSDQEEKDALRAEFDEILSYAETLKVLPNPDIAIEELDNAVASYKSPEDFSKESVNAGLETDANVYFAKYASEMSDKLLAELPSEEQAEPSVEADDQLSRPEKIAQLRNQEVERVYNEPDDLRQAVVGARKNFISKMLEPMRDRYNNYPTDENEKNLLLIEADAKGFNELLKLSAQWQTEKQNDETTPDFSTYIGELMTKAENDFDAAYDANDRNNLPVGDPAREQMERNKFANRAGFSKSSYSLNGQITRSAAEKTMPQV